MVNVKLIVNLFKFKGVFFFLLTNIAVHFNHQNIATTLHLPLVYQRTLKSQIKSDGKNILEKMTRGIYV